MKKFTSLVLLLAITASVTANAQTEQQQHSQRRKSLVELSNDVSELVTNYSSFLSDRDKLDVGYKMQEIIATFRDYNIVENTTSLMCLSNGQDSVFEKFRVYDSKKSVSIGNWSSKESCQFSVNSVNRLGLTCLSNGQDSVFEKFRIYDSQNSANVGIWSSKESCALAITKMNAKGMTCLSNGQDSVFEKFKLYNVRTNSSIGEWTSEESCLSSLGSL
jgi:hypothetical protein